MEQLGIKVGELRISSIRVKGKDIAVPEDARITEITVQVLCLAGTSCDSDDVPIYRVERGHSAIAVSRLGTVFLETVAPGEEGAFEFIREALR